ncbi:MAG: FxsA family protein, partial [Actinomycetota bacterium]|nr:FxsA family protein [Actinomycetota bacterium]
MLPALVVLLIAVPIAELYVVVQVAHLIGLIDTLVLLIALSVLGGWLLKREGMATWRRIHETLRAGHMPGKEITDGALILLGGA